MEQTRYKYRSWCHDNSVSWPLQSQNDYGVSWSFDEDGTATMVCMVGTIVESPRYGSLRAVTRVHSSQLWYGIIRLLHSYSQHIVFTPLPTLVWYPFSRQYYSMVWYGGMVPYK